VIEKAKYLAELLRDWKSQREEDGAAALRSLRGLTEEKLQELITKAIEVRDKKNEDTLARFAETDSEAAALLKDLIEELNDRCKSTAIGDSLSRTEKFTRTSKLKNSASQEFGKIFSTLDASKLVQCHD
jgi:hypothetical protein